MTKKEMVLFPTKEQLLLKTSELDEGVCYWTIPIFPKDMKALVGNKIYFYDKNRNTIVKRATIIGFGFVFQGVIITPEQVQLIKQEYKIKYRAPFPNGLLKKVVLFKYAKGDRIFYKDLNKLKIKKRTQTRGWAYRWF